MQRISRSSDSGMVQVEALKDVSFSAEPGDRIGLIGRNGSGKSTALRLAAGLAFPQKGSVEVSGRVVSLIELGLGVNPELSGKDNIELPLRLLGATTEEINGVMEDIKEFAGIGDFFHLPVRTYSAGMRARLGFAICTSITADVLVMDEWLGTGDAQFVGRAQDRLMSLVDRAKILLLASHAPDLVASVCNKAVWLESGKIAAYGPAEEVVASYLEFTSDPDSPQLAVAE